MMRRLIRDRDGATMVEFAFAFPALIILLWTVMQFGLVFRANSGIQHALGEGARRATLFPKPTNAQITARMNAVVYGIGPGTFVNTVTDPVDDPATATTDESKAGYKDLTVRYTQSTNFILLPGPNIDITKTKRVWLAN